MKIRQIRLQNVKSYADETIDFNDGVNFISGVNGAGKTTIIESIGYGLFNSKPVNMGEFIRYGQRTGIITILFEANDGRAYRVIRKFGGVNSWIVFDEETASEVDLHGTVDVVPWLKEVLGVEPEQDLPKLFEDVVGVSQGTFTTPFLETPSVRKIKFNKIFEVDSYKDAYDRMRSVIRRLEELTNSLKVDKAGKEGYIKDFDLLRTNMEGMIPEIARLEKAADEKRAEKDRREKERDALKEREREIAKTTRDVRVKEERIKNLEASIVKLGEDLKNARVSAEFVKQNTPGYQAYILYKKEQEKLEALRKDRDLLKDTLSRCEQEYGARSAELDAENRAIKSDGDMLKEEKLQAENAYDVSQKCEKKSMESLQSVLGVREKAGRYHEAVLLFEKCASEASRQNVRLMSGLEKWELLHKNIRDIKAGTDKENELKARMEALSSLEAEKTVLAGERAVLLQSLKNLQESLEKSVDGKCPFLDAPCRNIEGDLKSYFEGKIAKERSALDAAEAREKELDRLLEEAGGVRREALQLDNDRAALDKLKQEESKFPPEFKRSIEMFARTLLENKAAEVFNRAGDISDSIGAFSKGYMERKAQFEDFHNELSSFITVWETFNSMAQGSDLYDIDKVREFVDHTSNLSERAGRLLDAGRKLDESFSSSVTEEYNEKLSDNVRDKKDLANAGKKLEELRLKALKLEERTANTKELGVKLEQLAKKKADLNARLNTFADLDEKINNTQARLIENQEAYDTYMKHQVGALRAGPLSAELEKQTANIGAERIQLKQLEDRLAALSGEFSEEVLKAAEALAEKLGGELAAMETSLAERRSDLKELEEKLKYMEKLKKEIAEIDKKIANNEKIKDAAGFVRNILNRAGERVSAVYREHLANEANKLYREVSRENVVLEWRDDYEVFLVDVQNGRKRERCFRQLSGGEQMTAALAMRLGMLNQLSGVGVGFFDEPTTNLDGERRSNLAQILPMVTGGFDQLFVISHDDSFDSMTENIVQLKKDSGEGTKLM